VRHAGIGYHVPMRLVVDFLQFLAAIVVAPMIAYRALTTTKYRQGWSQRLGGMPDLPVSSKVRPRIWVHAVSVGEVNAVRMLIERWREQRPETELVISTTTDTGYARACEVFGDASIVRYPLDLSPFVSRALKRIKPSMIVLVELEVWYQFVTMATARGIPVVVINGRLSEKSVRRFGWVRPVAGRMFRELAWVGAQDDAYADRFATMGVPAERLSVTGSLKWETAQIADTLPGADEFARALGISRDRPTWVCGSTAPGEEPVILQAFRQIRVIQPKLQLVIVPRKPERFDEVAEHIRRAGFECVRRSESPDGTDRAPAETAVVLGDTMGELRKAYCLASVVFVGRTLANMGGSDMMEVAALAKPIVVGPHTGNFRDAIEQLRRDDALVELSVDLEAPDVADRLADAIGELLRDGEKACKMAGRGREVVTRNQGSTQRTLDRLWALLERDPAL
jgi:3-deoxy-D-manno-octulosonic-acid transferase